MSDESVQETWETFWWPIIKDAEGSKMGANLTEAQLEQIKRELSDYASLMTNVSHVYCELSGGRMSKPNVIASQATSVIDEAMREALGRDFIEFLNFERSDRRPDDQVFIDELIEKARVEFGVPVDA